MYTRSYVPHCLAKSIDTPLDLLYSSENKKSIFSPQGRLLDPNPRPAQHNSGDSKFLF